MGRASGPGPASGGVGRLLALEDVARLPLPGTSAPTAIAFSPDGRLVTYLLAGADDLARRLMALSLEDGSTSVLVDVGEPVAEEDLPPEERLRRERQREYGLGVTSYAWAKDAAVLLVPRADGVLVDGSVRVEGAVVDPQLSPDGTRLAYVRDGELWVDDSLVSPGGAADGLTFGLAEYIAQEEMDRAHGFWWSCDGSRLAYCEVDERHIPEFRIAHSGSDEVEDEVHRYPFVGADNAKVRLWLTNPSAVLEFEDEYLARVDWCPDGSLLVQTEDRAQQRLTLWRIDAGGAGAQESDQSALAAPTGGASAQNSRQKALAAPTGGAGAPDSRQSALAAHGEGTGAQQSDQSGLAAHGEGTGAQQSHQNVLAAHGERAGAQNSRQKLLMEQSDRAGAQNSRQKLLVEQSDVWINLHDLLRPLPDGRFLWASERSGFRHLYLYERDGTLVRQLTDGEWQVDSVDGVDAEAGRVWFSGTAEGPTERHLYETSFDGGGGGDGDGGPASVRRLTDAPGTHQCTVDPKLGLFVDLHSAVGAQPTAAVRRLADGSVVHPLFDRPDPRVERLGLRPPQLITFENRAGTVLHGALFKPDDGTDGPWPTVIWVYGGPHAQMAPNAWQVTAAMRAQYLRAQGFLVAVCDNRGSARRGLAFEGVLKGRLGDVEVDDQVDFVHWLRAQGLADPERVGVYGWSYGGYMALMLLARAPDVFRAAVAGAPVAAWDGYDTHYTERYLGLLPDNATGYEASAVFPYVKDMGGALMIVHGLLDENVHFRHTARLANRLIAARHDYELLLFPEERHGPRKLEDRVYLEQRITAFLAQHLEPNWARSPQHDAVSAPKTAGPPPPGS